MTLVIKEIICKSALAKCGFPGGGLAINPYVGCGHNCAYCYARFIKRFTGHCEKWGSFVDARINVVEVLRKQLRSKKIKPHEQIYLGTVTDPYQPLEAKYKLTRKILEVLKDYKFSVSILTKSDLVLRDIDLLRQFKNLDVNFTITTLDEKWRFLVEPGAVSIVKRLKAAKKLHEAGINVLAMVGPYWPFFTEPDKLFKEFKKSGIRHVFSESFNTTGGNFNEVEQIIKKNYPKLLQQMKVVLFDKDKFAIFYQEARQKLMAASRKFAIPVTVYFGRGHAAKFKKV